MSTLKETRMISMHQLGRRDFQEGRKMLMPVYITDTDERDSYVAGYQGEARREREKQARALVAENDDYVLRMVKGKVVVWCTSSDHEVEF